MRPSHLPLLLLLLLAGACNTAQKAYNRGDYEQAVRLSVNTLREDPRDRQARRVLVNAYNRAVEANLRDVETYGALEDPFRFERVAMAYDRLNTLHNRLDRCAVCDDLLPERRLYTDEWNDSRQKAAEARYELGLRQMQDESREESKKAVESFMVVERFVPGYRDTRARMEQALERATLHVVVEPMPEQPRALQGAQELFEQKLMESVSGNRMNRWVRFYTAGEAASNPPPYEDHVIRLAFESFAVGNTHSSSSTETLTSADSVKVGETRIDGRLVEVFGKVSARYTAHRKTVASGGLLDIRILDRSTGRVILQDRIDGEFVWEHRWASFNGDERALNSEQRRLAEFRELPPPPPDVLFLEFTGPIHGRLTDRLRRFYAGY